MIFHFKIRINQDKCERNLNSISENGMMKSYCGKEHKR